MNVTTKTYHRFLGAAIAGAAALALAACPSGCDKKKNRACGNGVCETTEDATGCFEDCGCGNGILNTDQGEECDGDDFGSRNCLTEGCSGGTLGCDSGCRIDTAACTGCPTCGDGQHQPGEGCDCGNDPSDLPAGCTDVNGGANANCSDGCVCQNRCGDGVLEVCETCDCGADATSMPGGCSRVNGDPDGPCDAGCQEQNCGGPFDDCNPMDPDPCCDDGRPGCDLVGYCESSAFTTPVCMMACSTTPECYFNSFCDTRFGMCYPALCGTNPSAVLGGQTNAPCQVPQGNPGWCLPLGLAKDDLGVCVESATQQHGEPCTDYEYIDLTKLCRGDPDVRVCAGGVCSNDLTCLAFCDPNEVYSSGTDSCPAGYNCWNYSNIDENDTETAGCRSSDFGICMPDDNTDPAAGLTSCDLTNGELIGDRIHTCADLNPAWECVMVNYQDGGTSWNRIGACADIMGTPDKALWEACDQNSTCPPGSVCIEEDIFSTNQQGQTRCVPFCDTENATLCSDQHAEVPIDAVCTTVSHLFDGLVCTETSFSKLGLCACQSGGCGIGLCGNGVIDGNETCDGTDVGIHTCQYYGLGSGVMGCTPTCDATDPSQCS